MRIALIVLAGIAATLVLAFCAFLAATWAPERSVAELAPRWAPPPSFFLPIAGMQVHVRDEGPRDDPSPIVLMHGTGSSLHAWEAWARSLRNARRVITFDLPAYGLTGPSPDNIYSLESDVSFVIEILDK